MTIKTEGFENKNIEDYPNSLFPKDRKGDLDDKGRLKVDESIKDYRKTNL